MSQINGVHTPEKWTSGDTTITAVVEAETTGIPVQFFFPDATADDVRSTTWLEEPVARPDGTIAMRVQAFVVRQPGRTVLIDPCVGNDKARQLPFWHQLQTPWLERLAAAGFVPDDIDLVVHTHLHEDHIGWDTHLVDGEWVPTFTNARHVYVGDELDHRRAPGNDTAADGDSIAPIFAAGLADVVTATHDLGLGMRLVPTPGHTPGHVAVEIATSDEPIVITGDLLHHQAQLTHPQWAEIADADPDLARTTRADFFSHHAAHGTLLAATHFAVAPVGRIESHASTWRFRPEPGEGCR